MVVQEETKSPSEVSSPEGGPGHDEFNDRFELREEIGSGSFGSVYRGFDHYTGKEVAIKVEKIRKGRPSSIAAEIRYYEKLLESQDMNDNQELQLHLDHETQQNGQNENVTVDHDFEPTTAIDTEYEREGLIEGTNGWDVEQEENVANAESDEEGRKQEDHNVEVPSPSFVGIPKLIFSGMAGKRYVIVMEMLGANLEKLFNTCNRRFSLKTVTQIALQLLDRIEFIHSKGVLHRDIKPENFVIGKWEEKDISIRNTLHIVDFGLSKFYLNQVTGAHNPPLTGKELTGTARYVSLRTHNGEEQSRRDDLEAIGHMLIYFMRGSLPW